MFDIAANLADSSFRIDVERVISRAVESGVTRMLAVGSDLESTAGCLEIAAAHPEYVVASAGVHPHYVAKAPDDFITVIEHRLEDENCVAVGECGLDFCRMLSPREIQEERFAMQLELAARTGRPAYLHERDAAESMLAILREYRPRLSRAVIHCFTADDATLDAYIELDMHIGVTGWIADDRRGRRLRDQVARIPQDRLMIETDSPYLLPRNIRPKPKSRRNEPAFLTYVRDAVAECTGRSQDQIAEETHAVAEQFFSID